MSGTDSHRVDKKGGIYVASRVSRADIWRNLRDNMGIAITSSWIDEAGEGETADFGELWTRIQREISSSTGLVFYADVSDAPWKGALVEIGMALAMGKPIGVVLIGELEGRTLRPIGSWLHHPSVKVCAFIEDAIDHAQAGASAASETGTTDAKDVTIKHWCKRALDAEADAAAVRELMNVYNLGGWTDAVAPMKRALKAEADLKALGDNLELLRARMVLATDDEIMRQESAASEGSHTANRSENMSDELPGMLAVAEGVAKQEWPHTMDAQVWAREFDKMYPMLWRDGDAISDVEGVMLSLLANAIMAGYDTANARRSENPEPLQPDIPLEVPPQSAPCVARPTQSNTAWLKSIADYMEQLENFDDAKRLRALADELYDHAAHFEKPRKEDLISLGGEGPK